MPSPDISRRVRQQDRFFCPCQFESLLEDLDFHRLAAQQPLQFAHALFKAADFGRRNHLVVGPDGFLAPSLISRLQRNTRLGESP